MLIPLIAFGTAIAAYCVMMLLLSDTPRERVRNRLKKLADRAELDHVHEAVLKEKKIKLKTQKKTKLVSRRFEDNLAMSGIQLNAREYILLWSGLTLLPGLLGFVFGLH